MFIEYPKALYLNGDSQAEEVLVKDAEEEAAKRAEGFRVYGEVQEQPGEETAESLRVKLDAAGIEYDKRWGIAKLKAALPE